MATDGELTRAYWLAADTPGIDSPDYRAGLRAIYNAGLTRAAEIARRQDYGDKLLDRTEVDDVADARARSIAAAIEAERGQGSNA